jgi:hypothetical protein
MKLNNLRQLVKEELTKAINENTPKYSKGDTLIYMGTKLLVVSDDGFIIKAMAPSGKIFKINYGQLKDRVSENETMRDLKDMPLENMEEGTYKIDYIIADADGVPDYSDSDTITITKDELSAQGMKRFLDKNPSKIDEVLNQNESFKFLPFQKNYNTWSSLSSKR